LCARLRRGVLYRIAKENGATKIALGHHADDFVETLLMNLFFAVRSRRCAKLSPTTARTCDPAAGLRRRGRGAGLREGERAADHRLLLPACGDLGLQRQRMKRLLMELEANIRA